MCDNILSFPRIGTVRVMFQMLHDKVAFLREIIITIRSEIYKIFLVMDMTRDSCIIRDKDTESDSFGPPSSLNDKIHSSFFALFCVLRIN